jgi:hypothetical protein
LIILSIFKAKKSPLVRILNKIFFSKLHGWLLCLFYTPIVELFINGIFCGNFFSLFLKTEKEISKGVNENFKGIFSILSFLGLVSFTLNYYLFVGLNLNHRLLNAAAGFRRDKDPELVLMSYILLKFGLLTLMGPITNILANTLCFGVITALAFYSPSFGNRFASIVFGLGYFSAFWFSTVQFIVFIFPDLTEHPLIYASFVFVFVAIAVISRSGNFEVSAIFQNLENLEGDKETEVLMIIENIGLALRNCEVDKQSKIFLLGYVDQYQKIVKEEDQDPLLTVTRLLGNRGYVSPKDYHESLKLNILRHINNLYMRAVKR